MGSIFLFRRDFADTPANGFNYRVGRRGSGCDSYNVVRVKPFAAQVICCLNMMNSLTMDAARGDQLPRVVAVRAANDDDDVAALSQFHGGVLSLLGRLADGVHEAHFGLREALADQLHQFADAFDGLRGLRNDAETGTRWKL